MSVRATPAPGKANRVSHKWRAPWVRLCALCFGIVVREVWGMMSGGWHGGGGRAEQDPDFVEGCGGPMYEFRATHTCSTEHCSACEDCLAQHVNIAQPVRTALPAELPSI